MPAPSKTMKCVPCRAFLRREYMHGHDQHKPKLTPHLVPIPHTLPPTHVHEPHLTCKLQTVCGGVQKRDALRWNNLIMSEIIPAQEFKSTLLWSLLSLWCVFVLVSQYWDWLKLTNGTKLWTVYSDIKLKWSIFLETVYLTKFTLEKCIMDLNHFTTEWQGGCSVGHTGG